MDSIDRDIKKIGLVLAAMCLAATAIGVVVGLFAAGSGYIPVVDVQSVSRVPRLKVDSRTDLLVLEVEGHTTQTTNLIEGQQSDGTVVFSLSNDGNVLISGTLAISDATAFTGDLNVTGYISASGHITTADTLYATAAELSGDLDMANNIITNIGAAGTDFTTVGGLVTASSITVTDGDLVVSSGDMELVDGGSTNEAPVLTMDAYNDDGWNAPILSMRYSLTDTIGEVVTTTSGDTLGTIYFYGVNSNGVRDTGGYITAYQEGAADSNEVPTTVVIYAVDTTGGDAALYVGPDNIEMSSETGVNFYINGPQEWTFVADELDATNGQIVNIGAAGTDFSATGGLTLADDLVVTGGITSTAGVLALQETTTPASVVNYARLYTKTDNDLYYQDGAGVEHTLLKGASSEQHSFYAPLEAATGVVGNWDIVEINTAQSVHFVCQIPEDFEVLDAAAIVIIPDATETIQWDILVSVAGVGEAYNNDDRSALDQTLAVTDTLLTELDISGQLTGLAAGDYIAIDFQSDTANLRIVGFEFDWN